MKARRGPRAFQIRSFRLKLLVAMMLVVSAITLAGIFFAQRRVMADAGRELERDFQGQLSALHRAEELRHAALTDRCRLLVAKPRLHAALEDNAIDLLYPTARDELRDFLQTQASSVPNEQSTATELTARFYRFLDGNGKVIPPPRGDEAGALVPNEEKQLSLPHLPRIEQIGYIARENTASGTVDELLTIPIPSTETGEMIAALVAGFAPVELQGTRAGNGMKGGVWLDNRLHLGGIDGAAQSQLANQLRTAIAVQPRQGSFSTMTNGVAALVFFKHLNPGAAYAPAYEVCVYPLSEFAVRRERLRWGVVGAGALLLVVGLIVSQFASARLSQPVAELAEDRERTEAALASTSSELQRSVRFSGDASHQLKTPVTVMRAGLESLLTRHDLAPEVYDELSSLLHQTYRLTGVINDLLLLARVDAGRVQIEFEAVNLTHLVNEWLDDLSALPDAIQIEIANDMPSDLQIAGEQRYTSLIVQNLLENARKYNRPGGRIRVAGEATDGFVKLTVCNTGRAIPAEAQEHIFERFHRGAMGENVPGHGLGLNLARELARLHGGDLWLVESNGDWTEFAVRFRAAQTTVAKQQASAA